MIEKRVKILDFVFPKPASGPGLAIVLEELDKASEQPRLSHCTKANLKTQTKITKTQTKTKWSQLSSAAKFIAFQNPELGVLKFLEQKMNHRHLKINSQKFN